MTDEAPVGDVKDVRALAADAVPSVCCCTNAVIELTAVCRTMSAVTAMSRSHCRATANALFNMLN